MAYGIEGSPEVRKAPPYLPTAAIITMILLLLAPRLAYLEFFGTATGAGLGGISGKGGHGISFEAGRSNLLGRETLRIIVITGKQFNTYSDGRRLDIAGHSLRGRGRIYLIDEEGRLTETEAPIFETLWRRWDYDGGDITRTLGNDAFFRPTWLREWIAAVTDPSSWDPPLREFLDRVGTRPPR